MLSWVIENSHMKNKDPNWFCIFDKSEKTNKSSKTSRSMCLKVYQMMCSKL